jgi:hypothetical protein
VIEPFPDADMRVRLAAFKFLEEQVRIHGEVLALTVLRAGFSLNGQPVRLMNAIQGIFKPAALTDMPLSITTTAPNESGRAALRRCDDGRGTVVPVPRRHSSRDFPLKLSR